MVQRSCLDCKYIDLRASQEPCASCMEVGPHGPYWEAQPDDYLPPEQNEILPPHPAHGNIDDGGVKQ